MTTWLRLALAQEGTGAAARAVRIVAEEEEVTFMLSMLSCGGGRVLATLCPIGWRRRVYVRACVRAKRCWMGVPSVVVGWGMCGGMMGWAGKLGSAHQGQVGMSWCLGVVCGFW